MKARHFFCNSARRTPKSLVLSLPVLQSHFLTTKDKAYMNGAF